MNDTHERLIVDLAVEAISMVCGAFTVKWYDPPFEGWDGLMRPEQDPDDPCYDVCCDGAPVTRQQVDALRSIGVEVSDA
jgi:hypothetical protein